MEIAKTITDGITAITLKGRLDTITAPKFQPELLAAIKETKNVAIDFAGVEYVSSAGLRTLLSGHKVAKNDGGKLIIKNVSGEIMEIFTITGFADMFNIER